MPTQREIDDAEYQAKRAVNRGRVAVVVLILVWIAVIAVGFAFGGGGTDERPVPDCTPVVYQPDC